MIYGMLFFNSKSIEKTGTEMYLEMSDNIFIILNLFYKISWE